MNGIDESKMGPLETGVHELILKRWSPRAFSEAPVSEEDLVKVFTAASWAASSYNEQPWRFLVGRKGDATYQRIFDTLIDFNKSWAAASPVLILAVAKRTITKDGSENGHALHDTGAASATMALEATALGLYVHGMGGCSRANARENFNLPSDFEPVTVWALGHLGDDSTFPSSLQALERAPRNRKALTELVFSDWEVPFLP